MTAAAPQPHPRAQTPARTRGRPRCPESHARIISATVELLESVPWAEVTIEAIAARAKVGKQTIYKWWGGRSALVMDAYLSSMQARIKVPDTGSIARDLVVYLTRSARLLRETGAGRTLAAIVAESQNDEKLARDFRDRFLASRRETMRRVLQRGIDRRELRDDLDLDLVMDLLYGIFWYRILIYKAPLDDRFVEDLIALLLPALRRGRGRSA